MKKMIFLLAFYLPTLSGCAPTNYMDKNPSSLPYHEKIWGYNQAALKNNYTEKEKFIHYFQSHLTPEEYILFSYLSSPGVGMSPNGSMGNILTGEARKLAMESNKFKIFNYDGSSSIYYTKNTARSRIVESGIVNYTAYTMGTLEDNKAVSMAVKLAEKGNTIACRYLRLEDAGSWLLGAEKWPDHLNLSKELLEKALKDCVNSGLSKGYLDRTLKRHSYYKEDKKYDQFFYSKNHINSMVKREKEQAIDYCSGVTIPEKISTNLVLSSTRSDREFHSSKNRAPLADWEKITYGRWIASEVAQELSEITQDGIPISIETTPIVAKDICKEIKIAESEQ